MVDSRFDGPLGEPAPRFPHCPGLPRRLLAGKRRCDLGRAKSSGAKAGVAFGRNRRCDLPRRGRQSQWFCHLRLRFEHHEFQDPHDDGQGMAAADFRVLLFFLSDPGCGLGRAAPGLEPENPAGGCFAFSRFLLPGRTLAPEYPPVPHRGAPPPGRQPARFWRGWLPPAAGSCAGASCPIVTRATAWLGWRATTFRAAS